ncbi:MAG: YaiO family outer membrane beta-barrel protein [Deltaproteobacteria bacterium]|nr:YaiO family outer membrane beta-barrel protein [Deltaproteobacteria bacterium]
MRKLIESEKFDEALAQLEARLQANPLDDEALLMHARILYWKGQWPRAEREVQDVLGRHPADRDALELQAQLRMVRGDLRGSVELLQRMQALGDDRPELQQKIIDLLVETEDTAAVRAALARGGALTHEQLLRIARIDHPILVDAGLSSTWHGAQWWPRVEAGLGYRFGAPLTLVAGVAAEQRNFHHVPTDAWTGKLEAYLNAGRLAAQLHASGSPSQAFLPVADLRADATVALNPNVALGLWLRLAHYAPSGEAAATPITIGPYLPLTRGPWQVAPGWLFLARNPGGWNHTAFLKFRYQATASTGWFVWVYGGQDPSYIDRLNALPSAGITGVVGVDHWFNGQFGVRASVSRNQPFGNFEGFTECSLSVRGRL